MVNTPIDNIPSGFIEVVPNAIVSVNCNLRLTLCSSLNFLQVLDTLQPCVFLVEPLVNRFERFAIHDKGCPSSANTSSKIIKSQVDCKRVIWIYKLWLYFCFHNIFDFKKSSFVFGQNANLFQFFIRQPLGKRDSYRTKLFPELIGHGNFKKTFFDLDTRHYQGEITIFGQISRQPDLLKAIQPLFYRFNQIKEGTKRTIYYLQRLLYNIGIEKLVVLVTFAMVVVRLVTQVPLFREKELPNRVKPYIVEVLAQVAQFPQRQKLLFIQVPNLALLS